MLQTKATKTCVRDPEWEAWIDSLEEVEYPPEVVARWDKEIEIADAQMATGELKPQTVAEFAAEFGIKLE